MDLDSIIEYLSNFYKKYEVEQGWGSNYSYQISLEIDTLFHSFLLKFMSYLQPNRIISLKFKNALSANYIDCLFLLSQKINSPIFKYLSKLDLSSNSLKDNIFDNISKFVFYKKNTLKEIDLSSNKLGSTRKSRIFFLSLKGDGLKLLKISNNLFDEEFFQILVELFTSNIYLDIEALNNKFSRQCVNSTFGFKNNLNVEGDNVLSFSFENSPIYKIKQIKEIAIHIQPMRPSHSVRDLMNRYVRYYDDYLSGLSIKNINLSGEICDVIMDRIVEDLDHIISILTVSFKYGLPESLIACIQSFSSIEVLGIESSDDDNVNSLFELLEKIPKSRLKKIHLKGMFLSMGVTEILMKLLIVHGLDELEFENCGYLDNFTMDPIIQAGELCKVKKIIINCCFWSYTQELENNLKNTEIIKKS